MTEPRFFIGQAVAVCSKSLRFVIPQTIIVDIELREEGRVHDPFSGEIRISSKGWAYFVKDSPICKCPASCGKRIAFRESSLRPIDPGKEYQDDEKSELIYE